MPKPAISTAMDRSVAHQKNKKASGLDTTIDRCNRSQHFPNETKRIEFLFELYDKYTAGLFVKEKKAPRRKA